MIEVQTRMIRRLTCLAQQHAGETVAVVSHGDPLRTVVAYCLGMPLDMLTRFDIGLASVSIAQVGEWAPRVICVNHTGGLPA